MIRQQPLVLHSDNGSPMKGATVLETLYSLGTSRSRPRVSNDNPYAESIFRTCKYRPDYPAKGFKGLTQARVWVNQFASWYNTPSQRHKGLAGEVFEKRRGVYESAKVKNPSRWSGEMRDWSLKDEVWLNPEKVTGLQAAQNSLSGQQTTF
ncbi:transposase [Paenibacillus sp. IB182496]|uniref:Transposase n=1 Tax=Paenibacillus sabuli TaxID=2772509 RepID=A0A927BW91_9BACL|nr:integrase core domain-containing protein [Paenibacillus sabuli]MBD2847462.1 transposase [Paenibacillus sabuli]